MHVDDQAPGQPVVAAPTAVGGARVPAVEAAWGLVPPWPVVAVVGLVGLAFIGLFHFVLIQQGRLSWGNADWQHSFVVPVISLYMLWQWRQKILSLRPMLFWPGLIPLLLSVPCYLLFQVGAFSNHMGQGISMLLGLFGVLLLLLGPRMIQPVFLPLAFLAFGITVSEMIMIEITFRLQGLAAHGGYVVLNLLGVVTDIDGHTLRVTHPRTGVVIPLNIAEACSGMRMLIAFLALGVAVALVGLKHWWQRIALIASGVPVALVMNIVRVAVLGLLSLQNPEWARGQAHMFIGFVLLVGAFMLFLGLAWVLQKVVNEDDASVSAKALADKGSKATAKAPADKPSSAVAWPAVGWSVLRQPGVLAVLVVLVFSAVSIGGAIAALGINLRKLPIQAAGDRKVAAIVRETENWVQVGQDEVLSEEMLEELGTHNYLTRTYIQRSADKTRSGGPAVVNLHLTYYTGMIDTVPHVPERCMTGAGFAMVSAPKVLAVPLQRSRWVLDEDASAVAGVPIYGARTGPYSDLPMRVRLPRGIEDLQMSFSSFANGGGGGTTHAGYFFIANGGWTASAKDVRVLAFDLKADYAYFLKVQISSSSVASAEELAKLGGSLLSELLPEIARTTPDWIEVQRGAYPPDNPRKGGSDSARGEPAKP